MSNKVSLEEANIGKVKQEIEDSKSNRSLREYVAKRMLYIFYFTIAATFTLLFFNGFNLTNLSDKILISLLINFVANLSGIILTIAKDLFPKK